MRRFGLGTALLLAAAMPALAGSRLIFPRIPSSETRFTGIAVLNPGTDSAPVTMTAYRSDGSLVAGPGITNPAQVSIGPGSQYSKLAVEIFGGKGPADYDWIEVSSTAEDLTGFFLEGSTDGRAMDGSELTAIGTDLILPLVEPTTEISVVNPEPTRADVEIDLVRADGTTARSLPIAIEARGALQTSVGSILSAPLEGIAGLRVRSSQPVACFGFYARATGDSFAIMAAQDATVPSRTLYLPQFLDGGEWTTKVGLWNLNSSATVVTLTAFDAAGQLLAAPDVKTNPVSLVLPRSGILRADLRSLFGLEGESLKSGWLRIDAGEKAIRGYLDFSVGAERMFESGRLIGYNRFVFAHQVTTEPFFTSLALLNSGQLTANIEVASLDPDGQVRGRYQGILRAGQQLVSTVDQLIPGARGAAGGAVFVQSDVPLMASEIFGTEALAALSSISPQTLPASFDPTAGMPRVRVAPPLAVVETGKSVRFNANPSAVDWLLNGVKGGTAGTGSLSTAGVYTAPKLAPPQRTLSVQAVAGTLSAGASVDVVQRESLVSGLSIVTAVAYADSLRRFYVAEQQLLAQEARDGEKLDAGSALARVLERTPSGDLKTLLALPLETIAKIVPFTAAEKTYLLLAGLDRGAIYRFDTATQELATVATGLKRPTSMALDTFSGDLLVAESETGQIVLIKRRSFDPSAGAAPETAAESAEAQEAPPRQQLLLPGVMGLAFDSCTGAIYAASSDGTLLEYLGNRVETIVSGLDQPRQLLVLHRTGVSPCEEGVTIMVAEPDRVLQVDPGRREVHVFAEGLKNISDLAFMTTGNSLAEGGEQAVLVSDLPTGPGSARVQAFLTGRLYESTSGEWPESDIRNAQQAGTMPFTDPRGDTFETSATHEAGLAAIDLLSINGQRIGRDYVLTLTFSAPVQPLWVHAPNSIDGRIDIETGAGGLESSALSYNPFRQPVGVGVTATIDLGRATMTVMGAPPKTGPVEMHFVSNVVTVAIPLPELDMSRAKIVAVVGNRLEPTDIMPNWRFIGVDTVPPQQEAGVPTAEFRQDASSGLESVSTVTIPVILLPPSANTVTVEYAVSGGSASGNGSDYLLVPGTLTFPPGTTTQNITLTLVDDTVAEGRKTVVITLASPKNAQLGTIISYEYAIVDDDTPSTIVLAPSPLNLSPGEVADLTLSLGSPTGPLPLQVMLTSSDPAVATAPSFVSVAGGASTATFQVTAGSTAGSATITASAAGYPAGTTEVVVSGLPAIAMTPTPLTLNVSQSASVTLTLGVAAGVDGVSVTLVNLGPQGVSIPPALSVAAGQKSATFALAAGDLPGLATVRASAPGYVDGILNVVIKPTDGLPKNPATLALGGLNQIYDGTPKSVSVTTSPAGLGGVTVTYNGSTTAPTNAGSYAVVAKLSHPDYEAPDVSGTLTIAKATATLTLGGLSQTYDGTPRSVTVTTSPAGLGGVTVTYNGSPTPPTSAGSYAVVATLSNPNAAAPDAAGTLTIVKAGATLTLGALSQAYDGTPKTVTVTTSPAGLTGVTVTYDGSPTPPTNAGSYAVVASLSNPDYAATDVSGTLTIARASATLTLGNLSQTYDGSPKTVTVTTTPAGLTGVTVTYNGSPTPPTNAGSYAVVASLSNSNYAAPDASGTLTIAKASATLTLGNLSQTYDGSPKTVTVTTTPAGLTGVTVTYDGSTTPPTNAGSYAVVASLSNPNATAPDAAGTLTIAKASATLTLGNLSQTYDGSPKAVSVSTVPGGLGVDVTYNGSSTPPVNAGSYAVAAQVTDSNYQASANATLVVARASQTITFAPLPDLVYAAQKFEVSATASSGLPVSFSATGSCTIAAGAATLDAKDSHVAAAVIGGGWIVTVTGAGSCTITASQPGDSNYQPAVPVSRTFTIAKAATSTQIVSHTPNPSTPIQAVTVVFTVTAATQGIGSPTGTVTVSDGVASCSASVTDGSCSLILATLGSRTLTATYSGDANFNPSSGTAAHVVSTLP